MFCLRLITLEALTSKLTITCLLLLKILTVNKAMELEKGFTLVKQGAEGRIFRGIYLGKPAIVKERFVKKYRHPDLDEHLTKDRIKSESRAIIRCKTVGIRTPTLYLVDLQRRRIYMEDIQGSQTVKSYFLDPNRSKDDIEKIATLIGQTLGRMHANNVIHGDLTTSNLLLQTNEDGSHQLVLIDFGLSHTAASAEDKGVDLYVLERALLSTHSRLDYLFPTILHAYTLENKSSAKTVIPKLEDIRARGRKRTMVG